MVITSLNNVSSKNILHKERRNVKSGKVFKQKLLPLLPKFFSSYLKAHGDFLGKFLQFHRLKQQGIEDSRETINRLGLPFKPDGMLYRFLRWYYKVRPQATYEVVYKEIPPYEVKCQQLDLDLSRIESFLRRNSYAIVTEMERDMYERTYRPRTTSTVAVITPKQVYLDNEDIPHKPRHFKIVINNVYSRIFQSFDIQTVMNWVRDLTREGIEPNPGPRRRNNRANQTRRRRRRPVNANRQQRNNPARSLNIVHFNNIMPFRKVATLTYLDNSTIRNNPGGSFLVYSMRINDLYDPDPIILSGNVSNFKEMMQFYSYARVLYTDILWTIVNNETFPLSAGIVFSQTNLTGVIASLADCQNAFENDFIVPIRTVSGKGGMDRTTFRLNRLNIGKLLGVGRQYRAESSYVSQGLATPSIPLWANFIVFAPTGASLANGYSNSTTLAMSAEFFGRLNVRS